MAVDSMDDTHGSTAPPEPLDMFAFYQNGVRGFNATGQPRLFSLTAGQFTCAGTGHPVSDGRRRLHWWVPMLIGANGTEEQDHWAIHGGWVVWRVATV